MKHPLKGDEATGLHIVGAEPSEAPTEGRQSQRLDHVGVTTVEEGATIGTTALVYGQLHSSLYTGAVQGYWSTPDWSDRRQGCRQVSTDWYILEFTLWWIFFSPHISWGGVNLCAVNNDPQFL